MITLITIPSCTRNQPQPRRLSLSGAVRWPRAVRESVDGFSGGTRGRAEAAGGEGAGAERRGRGGAAARGEGGETVGQKVVIHHGVEQTAERRGDKTCASGFTDQVGQQSLPVSLARPTQGRQTQRDHRREGERRILRGFVHAEPVAPCGVRRAWRLLLDTS